MREALTIDGGGKAVKARHARLAALFDVDAAAARGRRGGRRAQPEGADRLLRIGANRPRY